MNYHKQKTVLMLCFLVSFVKMNLAQDMVSARGFDFVVIIDQSGSMQGIGGAGIASDRLAVRNDMAKRAFDLVAQNGRINNKVHRFGVISFGTTVRVDLPLSPIIPTTIDSLRARLNLGLTDQSLVFTDFLLAFQEAQKLLSTPPQAEKEKRVILLITDGAPYVQGFNIFSYKEDLKEFIETSFPYPDFKLHVVALNDPASNFWDDYREFWKKLSHNQAQKLENDRGAIFRALQEEINKILGSTHGEHVIDNPIIPPYLESLVFDIFRVNPAVEVKIYPANEPDRSLEPGKPGVTFVNVGRTIQTITIKKPFPGLWKIEKSDQAAQVDIYMQQFFTRGKLLQPDPDRPVKQFEKVLVKYRVEDSDQKPLEEIRGYPLTLEVTLVKPNGDRVQMMMEKSPDPSEKSVFQTSEAVECDLTGEYRAEVLIATKDIKSRQVSLFCDQWARFLVQGSRLIKCILQEPKPFDNIPLFQDFPMVPKPLLVSFEFLDEDGDRLNLSAFFRGSLKNILTTQAVKEGREEAIPAEFTQTGQNLLQGKLGGCRTSGTHRLKFRINPGILPPNYTVKIVPDELVFTRGLSLLHWLQIVLAGLLLFSVLLFFGHRLFINFRFPLKGRLAIERLGKTMVAEYTLGQKRCRLILKQFPNETTIKKMVVRSKRDKSGGVIVTIIGEKRKVLLKDRILYDRGTATLRDVPYVLRFRLN